jgi:hypothetical protein
VFETFGRSALAAIALAGAIAAPPAQSDTLVVPEAFENADAPTSLVFPFAVGLFSNLPYRYQQVYAASDFPETEGGDVLTISAIRFRIDQPQGGKEAMTVQDTDVFVSTTAKGADGLSAGSEDALDSNPGADSALVYTGSLAWDPCGAADTCVLPPFDLEIVFGDPFVYDPASGNLLLEVFNFSTEFPFQLFDAVNAVDGISHVREVAVNGNPTMHEFPAASSTGLVTQFVFTVPEPGAFAAIATALATLAGTRRRRV